MRSDTQKKLFIDGFREMSKGTFTQIPGHILTFDPATQLAQLQIGIVGITEDGTFNHAPIIECPVHFAGGNDWSIDHKIEPNDEGMILFSQRCVDAWLQTGGIAKNPILRFHDKQDAFFLPGFRSKPNAITDFQNNGVRIRNDDASVYTWLKDDGTIESTNGTGTSTIKPDGEINLSNGSGYIKLLAGGNVDINGFIITTSGAASSPVSVSAPTVAAASSLTINSVEMKQHKHSAGTYTVGVNPVTGNSGEPV